ncbi:hypothetical protein [Planotetraspora phitsanulokensis]|uniref:hypothetical protein n=1 Tax=Planotetraspora phitsanulokensis TaxID=575192 RepID=UPI00195200BC|nr:hypothetical protein [Planotetraspora phitsanulokensis]
MITGAIALASAITTTSAGAATEDVTGSAFRHDALLSNSNPGPTRNKNRNNNRHKQRQHEHQHGHQRQHLLRDFTHVVTPFQKTDNQSNPVQKQDTESKAKAAYPPAPARPAPFVTPHKIPT